MTYDSIVIGAGYAGLMAALKLARAGQTVLLLAKGHGATHLRTGAIDLLGYNGARVARPLDALPQYAADHPDHPYARLGLAAVREAAAFFADVMAEAGYPFAGDGSENFITPTAVGAARPAAMLPLSMLAGDLRASGALAIVGFDNFKDFYPALVAANLSSTTPGQNSRALSLTAPGFEGEADLPPLALARAFEQAGFRQRLAHALRPRLQPGERVGLPAVVGLRGALTAWRDLQERLGAPVFEIPTLPPSIPGMRIFHAIEKLLRAAGARLQIGHAVIGANVEGRRVTAVITQGAARPMTWHARHVVLASGGVASGGVLVESDGTVRETIFNLPLAGLPARGAPRFSPRYFEPHPFSHVGVRVDEAMRPVGADGEPAYANLRACGALLAGAEPWREKSGEGISLASGYRAAAVILGET